MPCTWRQCALAAVFFFSLTHHELSPTTTTTTNPTTPHTPPSPSGRSVKGRGPQCLEPFTAVNRTWESPMWLSPRHTQILIHTHTNCLLWYDSGLLHESCVDFLSHCFTHTRTHAGTGRVFCLCPFPHLSMSPAFSKHTQLIMMMRCSWSVG